MKVLFIGHYKEGGGWSNASTDFILAMDRCGIDIVCRDIKLTNKKVDVPARVLELEQGDSSDCDICIQHVLPHHIVGSDKFRRNIAYVESETRDIDMLTWSEHLKLVDEVWAANRYIVNDLQEIGIDAYEVGHCHDIEKYKKTYPPISIPQAEGKFRFYFVGDFNDRKNIESIVRCFHSEFDKNEQVALILKVNKFGHDPQQLRGVVDQMIGRVKHSLRMYPNVHDYHKEIVITEFATEDNLQALHQYCDCFVAPSRGEAWSIPAFEAMAYGKTPIVTENDGPTAFVQRDIMKAGWLVPAVKRVCDSQDSAFAEMFTGREMWLQPCEESIRRGMRYYYNQRNPEKYRKEGMQHAAAFSYETIGEQIKELLSE